MMPVASRKVTVSLPEDLVHFADVKADERGTSRSELIGELLGDLRRRELDDLAREGYGFFAGESREFAESSARAVSEAIQDDGPPR